ncbi:hypothetical protein Taro_030767 [Colocasia esculenta]|uniref:Uncharacterized protein n=1 Tax=Colocasia esculenta TaxID=4460 RepID=A0A843VX38_COLES|nr:hypothetical protein [Colocasia esculenta]
MLGVQQSTTLAELLSIAKCHATCKESLMANRSDQGDPVDKKQSSDNSSDRERNKSRHRGNLPHRPCPFTKFIPLVEAPEEILAEIQDEQYVQWPPRMHPDPRRHNQDKYCRFHFDHGHNTFECRQLKDEIESLIKRGYLGRYMHQNEDCSRRQERTPKQPINNEPNRQEINVIVGGMPRQELGVNAIDAKVSHRHPAIVPSKLLNGQRLPPSSSG